MSSSTTTALSRQPLTQVATRAEVTASTFFVDDPDPVTLKDPKNNRAGYNVKPHTGTSYVIGVNRVGEDPNRLVYSGDTLPTEEFWRTVNGISDLRHLILETAFANRERDLAVTAKHLYPIQLSEELARLCVDPQIHITHLKPSDRELIAREIETWAGRFQPRILQTGDVLVIE